MAVILLARWPAHGQRPSAPALFGPNAFPVPEMADSTYQHVDIELKADAIYGTRHDRTTNLAFRVVVPLFTPRVNLAIWMQAREWWHYTPRSLAAMSLPPDTPLKGNAPGDIYVSTNIKVLLQQKHWADVVLRAALKSAYGGNSEYARYFDCPGYFFDCAVAHSFPLGRGFFRYLRPAASCGFLCWQVTQSDQNDALMYGVKAELGTSLFRLSAAYEGYNGWMHNGDSPRVVRVKLAFPLGLFMPFASYCGGVHDYPFQAVSVGCSLYLKHL